MAAERTLPFATLLARHRRAAGLSQEELAARAGLSARGIADLERGARRTPRRDTIQLLAEALALAPEERAAFERAARPVPSGVAPILSDADAPAGAVIGSPAVAHTPDERAGMLPPQLTPLIGREREEAAVFHLLRRQGARLLTLVGTGGVGKTRLAVQVAEGLRTDFADGVWFVRLSRLSDPALVIPTIAQALGVQEHGSQPIAATLRAYLAERQALLVLDNCEQVVAAAPDIVELLAGCPRVKALATSRTPLGVRGEQQLELSPLALPADGLVGDPGHPLDIERLQTYPAVALLVQRAQAVQPTFELTPANAAAVAGICRRLDGLPLALELAAAWIKLLPPAALLVRLERRLPMLKGGARDLPERQQTMERTIAWSYDLLSAAQQQYFRRLAVFVGGATLEAVEAVCGAPEGAEPLAAEALDGMSALVGHNLIQQREEQDEPRFGMLQTIREYGLDRLEANGEAETTRRAHAAYFLALVEQAEHELTGPDQDTWLSVLEREHDNVRAALGWARERGEAETGLRLVGAIWRFWWVRGHLREGQAWADAFLAMGADRGAGAGGDLVLTADQARASVRARALLAAGALTMDQGQYAVAESWLEQAATLGQRAGDRRTTARAFNALGLIAYHQRDLVRAAQRYEASLEFTREVGDWWGTSTVLANLGETAAYQGDLARAESAFAEALALFRQARARGGVAIALMSLGWVARKQGKLAQAEALGREALALFREQGDQRRCAEGLERLAGTAGVAGNGTRAACLLGAAAAVRERLGAPQPPDEQADTEEAVAAARAALGQEEWAAAFAAGHALSLEDAVLVALGEAANEPASAQGGSPSPAGAPGETPPASPDLASV